MTKQKSTKRALLLSALSLLMCVSMLIGSTFAWFTDSVTSAGNKIQAGTLKIDLELLEKKEDGSTKWTSLKDSKAPIFNYDKWEPGYTDVKILKVENEGTLALKWVAKFVSANDLTELANVIDVYVKPSADEFGYANDRTDLSTWTKKGTVAEFVNTISKTTYGNLEAGKAAYLGIALKMQESADNKYQGMDLGGAFDIMILATQYTSESDSFDDQYDKNATYLNKDESGNYLISTAAELVYFADSVNNGKKTYAGETVMLTADIDLANVAWSPIGQTCATEFKGVFDGQNHTIKNMTIVNTDESANCASGLFGWIESHDNNNPVTVKNVKFDNANVTGNHNVAVVAGYIYGTIENCEVKNSTVIGLNANDDANGDKVGVIAGYVGDSRINNNKVENCVVKGNRDVGGLAGVVHTGVLSFKNNSVKNTSVYYVTDRSYASAGELFSGRTTYTADSTNAVSGNKVMKGINVATFAELKEVFEKGGSVELTADIAITELVTIPAGVEVYLDMNGKTITPASADVDPLFDVKTGAALVIDGNGTFDLGEIGTVKGMSLMYPRGDVTINSGTFKIATNGTKYGSMFVGISGGQGKLIINGGYFDGGYYKEGDCFNNCRNLINGSWGQYIRIYGGTFVGQNPAWGDEGMAFLCPHCTHTPGQGYCQALFLEGQSREDTELPEGYTITEGTTADGRPTYTVNYSK